MWQFDSVTEEDAGAYLSWRLAPTLQHRSDNSYERREPWTTGIAFDFENGFDAPGIRTACDSRMRQMLVNTGGPLGLGHRLERVLADGGGLWSIGMGWYYLPRS